MHRHAFVASAGAVLANTKDVPARCGLKSRSSEWIASKQPERLRRESVFPSRSAERKASDYDRHSQSPPRRIHRTLKAAVSGAGDSANRDASRGYAASRNPSDVRKRRPGIAARLAGMRSRRVWQLRVFLTMLVGYAVYYICRSTFVYSAPIMQSSMNLTLAQVGFITSMFPSVYGVAKLFGGVMADVNSPRLVLAGGLFAIAICNLLFACGTGSVPYFALLWALNGVVSSIGFPACARLLGSWFSSSERGFYWGILNVSLNLGGFLAPVVVGTAASQLGWRFGMILPAVIALATGFLTLFAIRDSPEDAGLVSKPKPADIVQKTQRDAGTGHQPTQSGLRERVASAASTFRRQLLDGVVTVPPVWNLAVAYFFVYIIRQALTSWTVFYLMDAKGVKTLAEAALRVSGLELGGLLGSVSSGWLSDILIRRNPNAGAVGQRIRVASLYMILTAFATVAFYLVPVTRALLPLQWVVFAALGACLYGPQLLIGLSGAECVAPTCAGTSNGFLGTAAYTGAALAGLPLTYVVTKVGWNGYFAVLLVCCVATLGAILPLARNRSYEQNRTAQAPVA